MKSEAYLDIIWRQFSKYRLNIFCLILVGILFLIAIFAPLISCAHPLIFIEKVNGEEKISSPWLLWMLNPYNFVDIFDRGDGVFDYFFNMALLVFFPWLIICFVLLKKSAAPMRKKVPLMFLIYLLMTFLAGFILGLPGIHPSNLGTDGAGGDILTRLLYGSRIS